MQKITPFLWFNDNAEEAANFYTSIFKNSKIDHIARNGDNSPGPKGSVLMVTFTLEGQKFMALNGGPRFQFTEAISLYVNVKDQQELDYLWERLLEGGGHEQACGWLKDKYGLCWQIIPAQLGEFMSGDPEGAQRVLQAVWKMVKLDIATMQRAYEGV